MKKIIQYIFVAVAVAAVGVLLFSMLGAAVFFLPLLGGAFSK